MAITYSDAYGPVVDTGCGTQPTARGNVEVEAHFAGEVDSGSKTTPTAAHGGQPHREKKGPR